MNIREIHFNGTNRCRVVAGAAGRTFYSTPQAIGLALLGTPTVTDDEDTPVAITNIVWTDYLATNGVAIGTQGNRTLQLVLIPPKQRTVTWQGPAPSSGNPLPPDQLTVTFPHMLACLLLHRGVYERAALFMADATQQAQMNIASITPMLTAFPYGNVYEGHGQICWGSVRTADVRRIPDLETLFFTSGFNRDLYRGGAGSLKALVRATAGGILVPPTTYGTSISSVISNLMVAHT